MPATRLSQVPVSLSRYDVVGTDGAVTMFVRHVGLASREMGGIRHGDRVAVDHMGPPPQCSEETEAHVVGTAHLTFDEFKAIENFINEHLGEHQSQKKNVDPYRRFVIVPHAKPLKDNGVTVCMRFSCAGFVIEAYREAGIVMLDTDQLPTVTRGTLVEVYEFLKLDSWPGINAEYEFGLDDNADSWMVVLPGYVLHALNRQAGAIRSRPYTAQDGDHLFPR